MASVAEQILDRVQAVLETAGIVDNGNVTRGRDDAWGEDELPGLNIVRISTDAQSHAERLERHVLEFEVRHLTTSIAWETVVDHLHMQTHAALQADAVLQALGRGLRCTGTETHGQSSEIQAARLVARYQIQFLTRPGDLTRAIN